MQRFLNSSSESQHQQRNNQTSQGEHTHNLNNSAQLTSQRKKLGNLFGGAAQLQAAEEEPLQGKFDPAQRVEEEEPLQGKFEPVQRVEEEEPLQGKLEAAASVQMKEEAAKPNNTGLPDNLKSGIESLSGMSMDHVKVHYNSSQPAQLNALAYAQGSDIHVAPGQEQHLPHEAWHVVQQAQGRVKPTMQMQGGTPVNDDVGLESEADVMGAKAVQMKSYSGTVTIEQKIESKDLADWGKVRTKLRGVSKGGDAYGIGPKVNDSLTALGLNTGSEAMSAHMIPNRIGGSGDASNVRPWNRAFESGTWETSVEQEFDKALVGKEPGATVAYTVNTKDMSEEKAQEIIDKSGVSAEKGKAHHKDRISKIPLAVSAQVGDKALGETSECFDNLIK